MRRHPLLLLLGRILFGPAAGSGLLLEGGAVAFLLLESGDFLLLE